MVQGPAPTEHQQKDDEKENHDNVMGVRANAIGNGGKCFGRRRAYVQRRVGRRRGNWHRRRRHNLQPKR